MNPPLFTLLLVLPALALAPSPGSGPGPAALAEVVDVRSAAHAGFDRLVYQLDDRAAVVRRTDGADAWLVVTIAARPPQFAPPLARPRFGRLLIRTTEEGLELRAEGPPSRARVFLLENPFRVVLDFAEPGDEPFPVPDGAVAVAMAGADQPVPVAQTDPSRKPDPKALAEEPDSPPGRVGRRRAPERRLGGPVPQVRRVHLAEAIRMALENNLDLEVARSEPLVAREGVHQAEGAFDPLGFTESRFDRDEQPIASTVQSAFGSGTQIDSNQWTHSSGLSGKIPLGLSYSSTYNFERLDSTSGFNALDRQYTPTWLSEVRLPLLRDLFHNRANVTVKRSRLTRQISDEEFRRFLSDLLVEVERAYWELAAARAEVRVAEKSLQTANDLLKHTRVQYQVGVVSKVNVTQAVAGAAEREVTAITAENRAGRAQDNLLNAVAAPVLEVYAGTRLEAEDPAYIEYSVDETAAIEEAMSLRPNLEAARTRVEQAELEVAFARNQRLPRVDLFASYVFNGLSGPVKPGLTDPNGAPITNQRIGVKKDSTSSHDNFFRASGSRGWGIGARFEIPIGNRTARHRLTQTEIELRRSRAELRRLTQGVILEVRDAIRNLHSAIETIEATERRRVAQEETLRAEQKRLRLGESTPFQMLEFEEDLAEAERQEIGALQLYRNAISEIERARGTLLRRLSVSVEEEIERW